MTDLSAITVCVPGRFHPGGLARLKSTFNVVELAAADPALLDGKLAQEVQGIAVALTPLPGRFFEALPQLAVIGNFGVGYDCVDTAAATRKGVIVTHTPGVLDDEVADTALGLLLMTVRDLSRAEQHLRSGAWMKGNFPLTPLTLRNRTVGILGLGRIGRAIAKRLEAFGVTVAYHNRRAVEGVSYQHFADPLALASAVDTVINVLPGTAETRHLCGTAFFDALGANGVFINIGRGSTVDEEALAKALQSGTIAAAGLDVFETEPFLPTGLADCPNTVLLPHVASASVHTRGVMADLVVDNLISYFTNGSVLTPVPESVAMLSAR